MMNNQIKYLKDLLSYPQDEGKLYPSKQEILGYITLTMTIEEGSIRIISEKWNTEEILKSRQEVLEYFLQQVSKVVGPVRILHSTIYDTNTREWIIDFSDKKDPEATAKAFIYLMAVPGDLKDIGYKEGKIFSLVFYGELSDEVLNHYYDIQLDSELKTKSHIDKDSNLMIRLGNQELPEYLYQKILNVVQESIERAQVVELQGSYHLQIKPLPLEEN